MKHTKPSESGSFGFELRCDLKAVRQRLRLTQAELAARAGIARQTVGGIESGRYAPSAAVALRLSRALGCTVEELFALADEGVRIEARCASRSRPAKGGGVALARIGGSWVAHSLIGEDAYRTEAVPWDGVATTGSRGGAVRVRTGENLARLASTVVIAGCAPAISLWARSAEAWSPGLRVVWIKRNSRESLESVARGEAHLGGIHLESRDRPGANARQALELLDGLAPHLLTLGTWTEGLAVTKGNPLGLKSVTGLATGDARLANREPGSGARALLDSEMDRWRISPRSVTGYDSVYGGHIEVARAISQGQADAGICTESVACAFGLGFLPLEQVRFDLAIPAAFLDEEPVKLLIDTLTHASVRRQLELAGGFRTERCGALAAI